MFELFLRFIYDRYHRPVCDRFVQFTSIQFSSVHIDSRLICERYVMDCYENDVDEVMNTYLIDFINIFSIAEDLLEFKIRIF